MLLRAFHRRLRVATAILIAAGVCLALSGSLLATIHGERGRIGAFVVVAAVLCGLLPAVLRGGRWVVLPTVIVLGGQWVAVAATTIELLIGVDPIKAAQLRHLGVDPALGVGVNLTFSLGAGMLFVWFAIRYLALRHAPAPA